MQTLISSLVYSGIHSFMMTRISCFYFYRCSTSWIWLYFLFPLWINPAIEFPKRPPASILSSQMDSCEMYRARWPSKTGRYSTTVAAKFGTRACDNFTPRVFFPEFSGEKADDRILKIQKKRHVGKGKVKTRRCIMNSSINFDRINLLPVHTLVISL